MSSESNKFVDGGVEERYRENKNQYPDCSQNIDSQFQILRVGWTSGHIIRLQEYGPLLQ